MACFPTVGEDLEVGAEEYELEHLIPVPHPESLTRFVLLEAVLWLSAQDLCAVSSTSALSRGLAAEARALPLLRGWLSARSRAWNLEYREWQESLQHQDTMPLTTIEVMPLASELSAFVRFRRTRAEGEILEMQAEARRECICEVLFILRIIATMVCAIIGSAAAAIVILKGFKLALSGLQKSSVGVLGAVAYPVIS